MSLNIYFFILTFILITPTKGNKKYDPTWDSLDTRPLPTWYDEAKIGIFIHWSVWSVPAAGFNESAYLWEKINNGLPDAVNYMNKYYPKNFKYPEFGKEFKATFYDPEQWLDIFSSSGAKYIVFVSKHHEGYCMWPSKHSFNWNSMDYGPKRDLMGELFAITRAKSDLKIGLYYSLYEWYNPFYVNDRSSNFTIDDYVQLKMIPELKELTETYKPDVIWSDGDWESYADYWKSREFLAWLYNESEVKDQVVVNDRWGIGTLCQHGGFITCADKYNPGHLLDRKWENAMTLDYGSWGYRHNMKFDDIIKIEDLIKQVIITVSCGGNILINVGPTADGIIIPIFEERLRQLGEWLNINNEAIYSTKPWKIQNDPFGRNLTWYTSKTDVSKQFTNLYVLMLVSPLQLVDNEMRLKLKPEVNCSLIQGALIFGYNDAKATKSLTWNCDSVDWSIVYINFYGFSFNNLISKWSWVLKLNIFWN